jgi:hypothetical protein
LSFRNATLLREELLLFVSAGSKQIPADKAGVGMRRLRVYLQDCNIAEISPAIAGEERQRSFTPTKNLSHVISAGLGVPQARPLQYVP